MAVPRALAGGGARLLRPERGGGRKRAEIAGA